MVHTHTTTGIWGTYGHTKIGARTVAWGTVPANYFPEIRLHEMVRTVYCSLI